MNPEYGDIFTQRGDAYHRAMLRHPRARDAEFGLLFAGSPVQAGQRVLDLPSGGGYLGQHLPAGVELVGLELSSGFAADVAVHHEGQPWTFGRFDHAVCLAALHHIEDQPGFLRMLLSHLGPGGTLHLADVPRDSGVAHFLDGFVGRYNVTGHVGRYLGGDPSWFAAIGKLARLRECACPWRFDDEAQMLDFCGGLFGLVDCPPAALRDALARQVGFRHADDGVWLDWRLLYVDLEPA